MSPDSLPDHPAAATWRDDVADELQGLLDSELISDEQRKEIREVIVSKLNEKINIPVIGEAVEAAIIRFLLGLAEKVVSTIAKKYTGQILDAVRG